MRTFETVSRPSTGRRSPSSRRPGFRLCPIFISGWPSAAPVSPTLAAAPGGRPWPSREPYRTEVHGLDPDQGSIATAASHAESEGLGDRVSFPCGDAADALAGKFDMVTLFESLHDLAHPDDTLRVARSMLKSHRAVLVADERVAETFAAPGDDLERFNYGWSALHCLPASMTGPESAAIGIVIRPSTVAHLAKRAGFASCTVLPIEHDFWRFYRLDA